MKRLAAFALLVPLVLAACGGGGSSEAGSPTATATESSPSASASPTLSPPADCTDESSGAVFNLTMQNTAFTPTCVKARSEQSIHIENKDNLLHNFSITGTQIDVDVTPQRPFNGESAGLAPGVYEFFCKYHVSLGMKGTVVVV